MAGIDAYTKLMLHMDGSNGSVTFTDSSPSPKTVNPQATAQISTAQSVFGGASGLFDGNSDYLAIADSDDWQFDSGNGSPFTVDFRVRFNSVSGTQPIYSQILVGGNFHFIFYSAGVLYFGARDSASYKVYISCPFTPSTNTWYHIALVRVDATNSDAGWRMFVDGDSKTLSLVAGSYGGFIPNINGFLYIGINPAADTYLNGYLDELRISKGIARWTGNFTPPAEAY